MIITQGFSHSIDDKKPKWTTTVFFFEVIFRPNTIDLIVYFYISRKNINNVKFFRLDASNFGTYAQVHASELYVGWFRV